MRIASTKIVASRRDFMQSVSSTFGFVGAALCSMSVPSVSAAMLPRQSLSSLDAENFRAFLGSEFSFAPVAAAQIEAVAPRPFILNAVEPLETKQLDPRSAGIATQQRCFELHFQTTSSSDESPAPGLYQVTHAVLGAGMLFVTSSGDGRRLNATFNRIA
jgi:hypothetical protein